MRMEEHARREIELIIRELNRISDVSKKQFPYLGTMEFIRVREHLDYAETMFRVATLGGHNEASNG